MCGLSSEYRKLHDSSQFRLVVRWNFFVVDLFITQFPSPMSSEQIAKALKGAGLSAEERIDTAVQAWKNDKLFFPNKDDFLLEWLCTALTRSKLKS